MLRTEVDETSQNSPPKHVYFIVRMYKLDDPEPGIQILFDPKSALHKDELKWEVETVAVTPVKKNRHRDALSAEIGEF
jgi:hypothetical protein